MNDDIERLREWMSNNELDNKRLARKMGIPYISVHTVIDRRASTTDQFVNRFIRCFGYETAASIFKIHLAPVAVEDVAK